jgi:hypothetical protein
MITLSRGTSSGSNRSIKETSLFLLSLSFCGSIKDSCASVMSVMVEHLMNIPTSKNCLHICASIEEAMVDETCQSKLVNTSNGLLKIDIYLRTWV